MQAKIQVKTKDISGVMMYIRALAKSRLAGYVNNMQ